MNRIGTKRIFRNLSFLSRSIFFRAIGSSRLSGVEKTISCFDYGGIQNKRFQKRSFLKEYTKFNKLLPYSTKTDDDSKNNDNFIRNSSLFVFLSLAIYYAIKKLRKRRRRNHLLKIFCDPEKIDGYLFDFDDTLVDSDAQLVKPVMKFGRDTYIPNLLKLNFKNLYVGLYIKFYQLYQNHDEILSFIYDCYEDEIMERTGHSKEQFSQAFMDKFTSLYGDTVHFFPHSAQLLSTLRKKNKTASFVLATNSAKSFLDSFSKNKENLKTLNPHEFFDHILTFEDFEGRPKPDPLAYEKSVERIGSEPSKCIVFEDSRGGIKAGKAAGCYVVGLLNGMNSRRKLRKADLVISQEDLIDYLLGKKKKN